MMGLEISSLYTNHEFGSKRGCFYYGSKGWIYLATSEFKAFFDPKDEPGPSMTRSDSQLRTLKNHDKGNSKSTARIRELKYARFSNFIDCVRSRSWQDLNIHIMEEYMSAYIIHLGKVAYRTEQKLTFNSTSEVFIGDHADDANSILQGHIVLFMLSLIKFNLVSLIL